MFIICSAASQSFKIARLNTDGYDYCSTPFPFSLILRRFSVPRCLHGLAQPACLVGLFHIRACSRHFEAWRLLEAARHPFHQKCFRRKGLHKQAPSLNDHRPLKPQNYCNARAHVAHVAHVLDAAASLLLVGVYLGSLACLL